MEKVLELVKEKFEVKAASAINPQEFFKTREGLYVWSDFKERISDKAEVLKEGVEFTLNSYKTTKDATDEEIESDLPEKHIFSESEVCVIIADLISKQPKGEEGILLNTPYYSNLFYTPSFVVHVRWSSGGGEWIVSTWTRSDDRWFSGKRVFSPAN